MCVLAALDMAQNAKNYTSAQSDATNPSHHQIHTPLFLSPLSHSLSLPLSFQPELLKIKEYISRMSLLHHNVRWKLVNLNNRERRGRERVLSLIHPHRSVAMRFAHLHGDAALSNMVKVGAKLDGLSLSGLLSPPLSTHSRLTRDLQFLYVNNRYVRDLRSVSAVIEGVYAILVKREGFSPCGPQRMHFDPTSSRVACNASFVLQLSCPEDYLDLLFTPDKSSVVFREPNLVHKLVLAIIRPLVDEFHSNEIPRQNFIALEKFCRTIQAPITTLVPTYVSTPPSSDVRSGKRKVIELEPLFEDGEEWDIYRKRKDAAFESTFFPTDDNGIDSLSREVQRSPPSPSALLPSVLPSSPSPSPSPPSLTT